MAKTIDPALNDEARQLRREEHLGLAEIAARTGISKATLSGLLRDLPMPPAVWLERAQARARRVSAIRWSPFERQRRTAALGPAGR